MPLETPRLDEWTFTDLVKLARDRVTSECPAWTDLSPHDPGMVLIETFAFLTEAMIFRLNQLPEKVYIELLRLIGVRQQAPSAARVRLEFSLDQPQKIPVVIPADTRVAATIPGAAAGRIVFATTSEARIEAGQTTASALALHAELVVAERIGEGTGAPDLTLRVKRPPIIAPSGDDLDVVIGVEATAAEAAGLDSRRVGKKIYLIWREVENFGRLEEGARVFVADRVAGAILFAPAVRRLDAQGRLKAAATAAQVPGKGREILAWYRRGGGAEGNVAEATITQLVSPIPLLKVTNREPASGGGDAETLQNALLRGPEELYSLRRAVTAQDYELMARRTDSGIERARAVALADIWKHVGPGHVQVLLVPSLPAGVRPPEDKGVNAALLRKYAKEEIRERVQRDLDLRRPMGTTCAVSWAQYKTVSVKARVRIRPGADGPAIRARIESELYRYISPLVRADKTSWEFGGPLPASYVGYLIQREPGVVNAEELRLVVDEAPATATVVAADGSQPDTFYAGDHAALYRSLNRGDGWEKLATFEGEEIDRIEPHPTAAGLVAVASRAAAATEPGSPGRLHVSRDCGETWLLHRTLPRINDLTWTMRDGKPLLLLATDGGLFECGLEPDASTLLVVVDPAEHSLPLWAITSMADARGNWAVAVADQKRKAIWLSRQGGRMQSFAAWGLENQDVRALGFQQDGSRTFLWAGLTVPGAVAGGGCHVRELDSGDAWQARTDGWASGSTFAFAFQGSKVFAATHREGVVWFDSGKPFSGWTRPPPGCGLPERSQAKLFHPVKSIAALPGVLLAAVVPVADGEKPASPELSGIFRTFDQVQYRNCSRYELTTDFVALLSLPSTWLFCSGTHQIEVFS